MNRKQRRANKLQNPTTYTLTKEKMTEIAMKEVQEEQNRIRSLAFRDLVASFIITMHDKLGFGKKRIESFMEQVNTHFEAIGDNMVNVDDIIKECESIGLKFEQYYQDYKEDKKII